MLSILFVILALFAVLALIFFVTIYKKPLKKRPVLDLVPNLQQADIQLKGEIHTLVSSVLNIFGAHDLENLSTYKDHVKGIVEQYKTLLRQFTSAYEPFKSRKEYHHFVEVCELYDTSQQQFIRYAEIALHDLPLVAQWLEDYKQACKKIDTFIYYSGHDESSATSHIANANQALQTLQNIQTKIDPNVLQSPTLQKLAINTGNTLTTIIGLLTKYQSSITQAHIVTSNANEYNQVKEALDVASYEALFIKDFSYQNLDVAEDSIQKLRLDTPFDS